MKLISKLLLILLGCSSCDPNTHEFGFEAGCLCGCDLNDQNFVAEVARQNGYSEHFLAQTPKGNWMFDTTNAGKTAMIKFIQFLESNYFPSGVTIMRK